MYVVLFCFLNSLGNRKLNCKAAVENTEPWSTTVTLTCPLKCSQFSLNAQPRGKGGGAENTFPHTQLIFPCPWLILTCYF